MVLRAGLLDDFSLDFMPLNLHAFLSPGLMSMPKNLVVKIRIRADIGSTFQPSFAVGCTLVELNCHTADTLSLTGMRCLSVGLLATDHILIVVVCPTASVSAA